MCFSSLEVFHSVCARKFLDVASEGDNAFGLIVRKTVRKITTQTYRRDSDMLTPERQSLVKLYVTTATAGKPSP